jgi:hypothetical protein
MLVWAARAVGAKALGEEAAHGLVAHHDRGLHFALAQVLLKAKVMLVAGHRQRVLEHDQRLHACMRQKPSHAFPFLASCEEGMRAFLVLFVALAMASDVVILDESNFDSIVNGEKNVFVEFFGACA